MNPDLPEKQRIFVAEYATDWNGTKAAIAAGYSPKSARSIANKLLQKPHIQQAVTEHLSDLEKAAGITKLKVIREQMAVAFANMGNYFETWIKRKDYESLTDEQKACISEISYQTRIEQNEDGQSYEVEYVKFKLHDKQKALDGLSRLMGYDKPVKHSLTAGEKDEDLFAKFDSFMDSCLKLAQSPPPDDPERKHIQ